MSDALRRSLEALLLQLARASAVGLIDLMVTETALGTHTAPQALPKKTNGHRMSSESSMQRAKITGDLLACKLMVQSSISLAHVTSLRTKPAYFWSVAPATSCAARQDVRVTWNP